MFKCSESRKCGEPGVFCACKCACGIGIAVACVLVFGFVVQYLWNWLFPAISPAFGRIDYLQAVALLILARILFGKGGSHGHHRWGFGKGWLPGHSHEGCCGTEDWKFYDSWWNDEGKASYGKYVESRKAKDAPPAA